MTNISVAPDAIRAYGTTVAGIGTAIESASAMDLAANVAVMVPVFGLIGQDFLASFGGAQFANAVSTASLVAVHASTAASAFESAAGYESTDGGTAGALGSAGSTL
ncbi:type VII secretion target [Williamsia sp. M5A3_1d]